MNGCKIYQAGRDGKVKIKQREVRLNVRKRSNIENSTQTPSQNATAEEYKYLEKCGEVTGHLVSLFLETYIM